MTAPRVNALHVRAQHLETARGKRRSGEGRAHMKAGRT